VKKLFDKVIHFGSKVQKPFPMLGVDVSIGLEYGNSDGRAQSGRLGLLTKLRAGCGMATWISGGNV